MTSRKVRSKLGQYLLDHDIQQKRLVHELGVAQPTVSLWVTGKKAPRVDGALAVVRALEAITGEMLTVDDIWELV